MTKFLCKIKIFFIYIMNQVDVFELLLHYENNSIDVVIDHNDNIWFSGRRNNPKGLQVARILKYKYPKETIQKRIDKSDKMNIKIFRN